MKRKSDIIGIVNNGQVILPDKLRLPNGTKVRIVQEESNDPEYQFYDRQELSEQDIKADLAWATGRRFSK